MDMWPLTGGEGETSFVPVGGSTMARLGRWGIGVGVVAALILVAGWFDGTVMRDTQQQVSRTFDIGPALSIRALGYLLIGGGALVIGIVGWRLRSLSLGIVYVIFGAFFTLLDTIVWKLAARINDAPPVLPQPIAVAISHIYTWEVGPLSAVPILGAATLLVGLLVLAATIRRPSHTETRRPVAVEPGGAESAKV
jgi:hypothetical protein